MDIPEEIRPFVEWAKNILILRIHGTDETYSISESAIEFLDYGQKFEGGRVESEEVTLRVLHPAFQSVHYRISCGSNRSGVTIEMEPLLGLDD